MSSAEDGPAELTTFNCKGGYVYVPIPPPSSIGHRAELWNVDNWFKEVRVRGVTAGDNFYVRLEDLETGGLQPACHDATPHVNAMPTVSTCCLLC